MDDSFLERLRAEGVRESSGRFSLDERAAASRYVLIQKAEPSFFLLKLVQTAVCAGASRIQVTTSNRMVELEADVGELPERSFTHLRSAILAAHSAGAQVEWSHGLRARLTPPRAWWRPFESPWVSGLRSSLEERCWLNPVTMEVNGHSVNCGGADRWVGLPRIGRPGSSRNDPWLECPGQYLELADERTFRPGELFGVESLRHWHVRKVWQGARELAGTDRPRPHTALGVLEVPLDVELGNPSVPPRARLRVYCRYRGYSGKVFVVQEGVRLNALALELPVDAIVAWPEVTTDAEELTPRSIEPLQGRLREACEVVREALRPWVGRAGCRSALGLDPDSLREWLQGG